MRSTTELRQHTFREDAGLYGRSDAGQPVEAGVRDGHGTEMAGNDKKREERLAAALRENLKRRKAQARELTQPEKKDQP